ncbi:arginine--tRNA ligase [Candidatus Uhrbacteria bacterium]|nr:arginine--tRNA ligase [Candidatus Uhrbacteria bacterium]
MISYKKSKKQDKKERCQRFSEPFSELQREIAEAIHRVASSMQGIPLSPDSITFEIPPDSKFGDIAIPCFTLARAFKQNPAQIAILLQREISHPLIENVQAVGPYLNIYLQPSLTAARVLDEITASKQFGHVPFEVLREGGYETVVIEYVSPNTNKPIHLGHARNGFLGDSIARLLKAAGKRVIKTCLVNDRGIHICKSMVAYLENTKLKTQKLPTPASTKKKGDHFVGDYYVLYETLRKENSKIEDRAKECLLQWEADDKATRALWKKMNTWVLGGFKETFASLGLSFDKIYFESSIYKKGKEIIERAVKDGHLAKDVSGAVIARLEKHDLPDKVLLRSDGTSLYITQDMYLAQKRQKDFRAHSTLYVVGSEQDLYFKQLFKVLELIDPKQVRGLAHISYGIVNLPEGRMKSREGTVVDIDDLLAELADMVGKELDERTSLSKKERARRAQIIALAALKFFILEVTPRSDMVFNPKESLSFQGRTGPYLQYTYARLKSIIKKSKTAETAILKKSISTQYDWRAEKRLIISLAKYPTTLREAAEHYDPSQLARYLYELAKTANEYYHSHPILAAEKQIRDQRLCIVVAIARILKDGLALLGIKTLEEM